MPQSEGGVFSPRVQRLGRKYRFMRLSLALSVLLGGIWLFEGRAFYRRAIVGLDTVARTQRAGEGFIAISFPRISDKGERFTVSRRTRRTIRGLRAGYISIGAGRGGVLSQDRTSA